MENNKHDITFFAVMLDFFVIMLDKMVNTNVKYLFNPQITFFAVTLDSITFFAVMLDFFAVNFEIFNPFELISFRTSVGSLS